MLVAAHGAVLLDRSLSQPPPLARAYRGSTPDLESLLAEEDPVTAAVVRVDDTDGEIPVCRPAPEPDHREHVTARERPVHEVRGGGMSSSQFL